MLLDTSEGWCDVNLTEKYSSNQALLIQAQSDDENGIRHYYE